MATYYNFYLGMKDKNEKISICGPYICKDKEFHLKQLYVTTRSFINWEEFRDFMEPLSIEDMDPTQLGIMCVDESWSSEEEKLRSTAYICNLSEIYRQSKTGGLRQGYIPLDSFKYLKQQNYRVETIYDLDDFCTIEEIAEMDSESRKNYGKVTFTETYSVDYVADKIAIAASGVIGYADESKYYVICVIDY